MTVQCKVCGHMVTSLLVPNENACNEIAREFIDHVRIKHQKQAKQLAQTHAGLVKILVWYLAMGSLAQWDESNEPWLTKEYADWTLKIGEMLGWTLIGGNVAPPRSDTANLV